MSMIFIQKLSWSVNEKHYKAMQISNIIEKYKTLAQWHSVCSSDINK